MQPLEREYLALSKLNNLTFHHKVTMGFKHIKKNNVVGICTYGENWREIDVDVDYWNNIQPLERLALVFHELTHCYCRRDHDYGSGIKYPPTEEARVEQAKEWQRVGGPKPGRLEDGCPSSVMYPVVLNEECVQHHYNEYIKEMFNRCDPF